MSSQVSGRPLDGEFAPYAMVDIDAVPGDDAVKALQATAAETIGLLSSLDEAFVAGRTYAPGKWTIKQVAGHLADDERIFAYRALCIVRGDTRPLPGFDENEYMAATDFESRTLRSVCTFHGFERSRSASCSSSFFLMSCSSFRSTSRSASR